VSERESERARERESERARERESESERARAREREIFEILRSETPWAHILKSTRYGGLVEYFCLGSRV
jgi:hypothetical protein